MNRIQFSYRAVADLDGIWDFIADDHMRAADETV